MKKYFKIYTGILVFILTLSCINVNKVEATTYPKGIIKPNNYSEVELNKQVVKFYNQWKKRYLVEVENTEEPQKYVFYALDQEVEPPNAITCSEAMGYGLMISVIMSEHDDTAKANFDALYNYVKAHPSKYNENLMSWQQVKNDDGTIAETPTGDDSATDGDMDIAYALLLADKKWGSNGPINYKEEAIKRIRALMESCIDKENWVIVLGDWVFAKRVDLKTATRPSDFLIDHLREFKKVDCTNSENWQKVIDKTTEIINEQLISDESKNTGLMPDFMVRINGKYVPAKENILDESKEEPNHAGDYSYNACRIPWRYSMDVIMGGTTDVSQLTTLNNWIQSETNGKPGNIKAGYYIINGTPGQPFTENGNLAFTAPFMVSATIDSNNQKWLNDLWTYTIATKIQDNTYYGNTLKLLSMIVVSGNWESPSSN